MGEGDINKFLVAEKRGFEEKERAEQEVISERKKELERIEAERLAKEVYLTLTLSLSHPLPSSLS